MCRTHLSNKGGNILIGGVSFLIGLLIFGYIVKFNVWSDIQFHSKNLTDSLSIGFFPIPPLYHFFVFLFSFFQSAYFNIAAVLILSIAISLKAQVSCKAITEWSGRSDNNWLILLFTILLLFPFPIIYQSFDYSMHLSKISPTIWHNSTTIAVLPFAVLLFLHSVRLLKLENIQWKDLSFLLLFGLINILIKPSFLFGLLPALFVLVLLRNKSNKYLFRMFYGICLLFMMLVSSYLVIYFLTPINPANQFSNTGSGIGISVFFTYDFLKINQPLNLLSSFLFPLTCFIFYWKELSKMISVQLIVLTLFFAYLIGAIFVETGPRLYDANMIWQLYMSNYILFLICVSFLLGKFRNTIVLNAKNMILLLLFAAHVISGFIYLYKYLIFGNFR